MGAALRDLVQHRAPPQRHQVRDPGATPLRTGGVVAAGASTGLRGRQAGHAPALERTSDARLATRHRGLAQPRKGEHSRTAKFRACSLKKTDIFFDKHRQCAATSDRRREITNLNRERELSVRFRTLTRWRNDCQPIVLHRTPRHSSAKDGVGSAPAKSNSTRSYCSSACRTASRATIPFGRVASLNRSGTLILK